MKTPYYALALSVAVLAIASQPAHAQMRRSSPRTTADAAAADATGAGPIESPTTTALPRLELKLFIGPAFEGGNKITSTTRVQTTTTTNTTAGTTTTTAKPTINNTTAFGNGVGVMYGVDGTWWGSPRLGLGVGLFGAYLGAAQTNNILHLQGQQPQNLLDNQSTTIRETNTVYGSTFVQGAPNFGATIVPQGAPNSNNTVVTTTFTGFTVPGGGGFALSSGQTAAGAPNTVYSNASGGAGFAYNRTLFMDDISVHGDYLLVDTPAGGVSFFGGFTVPTGIEHRNLTARTVDGNGNAGTAKVTATTSGPTAADTYTTNTSYTFTDSYTSDTSFLALGPVIGLNAYYNVNPNVRLFTQVGYAPALLGQSTTNLSTNLNDNTTVTVTTAGNPAGVPAASNNTTNTTTASQAFANLNGTETLGTIGAGFNVGGVNVFVDGTARNYTLNGPELLFGANVGAAWGF